MKVFKFAINIPDQNAANSMKAQLLKIKNIVDCDIDLSDHDKIITIKTIDLSSEKLSKIIFNAGYRNEEIVPEWKKVIKFFTTKDCCK